mmetsp:Transcript_19414/g.55651  ORF Transcript_19414/g.55651 Transcript_19414/m.55651 type:complete len:200 (-) Transcript_19414:130-729(-)
MARFPEEVRLRPAPSHRRRVGDQLGLQTVGAQRCPRRRDRPGHSSRASLGAQHSHRRERRALLAGFLLCGHSGRDAPGLGVRRLDERGEPLVPYLARDGRHVLRVPVAHGHALERHRARVVPGLDARPPGPGLLHERLALDRRSVFARRGPVPRDGLGSVRLLVALPELGMRGLPRRVHVRGRARHRPGPLRERPGVHH